MRNGASGSWRALGVGRGRVDVVNRGDTAAAIFLPGGTEYPPFDVIVVAASGDTVWREPPPDAAREGSLQINPPIAPGETQPYGRALGASRYGAAPSESRHLRRQRDDLRARAVGQRVRRAGEGHDRSVTPYAPTTQNVSAPPNQRGICVSSSEFLPPPLDRPPQVA